MKSKIIYFDFDRTLLDTDALKIEQANRISRIANITVDQVNEGMKLYIEAIIDHFEFTPEGYAVFLEELYGVNPSDILKIYITDSNYIADFLFPEVLEVLKCLKERGHELGIFSAASPGHQRLKIERTGVFEYIEKHLIIIDPKKMGIDSLEKLPDEVTVIDDDCEIIRKLSKYMPRFNPIWCNRKSIDVMQNIQTIHDLRDLLK